MIDKIVLYTVEKKTKRQITMVLICRDSSEKNSGVVQVIFGANKPGATGRALLPFAREPLVTKDYHLLAMDLHLPRKIRHVVFGQIDQKIAWEKASKLADRFLMKAGRLGEHSNTSISKFNKKYKHPGKGAPFSCSPPIAVLITNSNALEKALKKTYTNSKKNE